MKKCFKLTILVGICLIMAGCADYVNFEQAAKITPVGFWYGLWHGMIAPLAWFISLFNDDVAIYAIYNNGGWYDFGFILGIGGGGGGAGSTVHYSRR